MKKNFIFMHLEEITVSRYGCLTFQMPKNEVGGRDVQIIIEFVPCSDDQDRTYLWVWAEVNHSSIRGLLLNAEIIDASATAQDFEQKVVQYLNENENFHQVLSDYIYWMDNSYTKV